ncbi:hypothetical protein thsrh120_58850 [Rhizobium sp. No.120]
MRIRIENVYNVLHKSRTIAYFLCRFIIAYTEAKFTTQIKLRNFSLLVGGSKTGTFDAVSFSNQRGR